MKINILICRDNDEQLINETVNSIDDAKELLTCFEYEYNAIQDAKDD